MNDRLRRLYTEKYRQSPDYGQSAKSHIETAKKFIQKRRWEKILDYGCGKAVLSQVIPGIVNYDFAIPEYCHLPEGVFDGAFCIDVLEHIPEEDLSETLTYLQQHAKEIYFCIHMGESVHKLSDGSPCHCTVKPASWWIRRLSVLWNNIELVSNGALHITLICTKQ